MQNGNPQADAWTLTLCASRVCKPLLWMHDSDSPQRLTPGLRAPLEDGLKTIARFPNALSALEDKMCAIYEVALSKPLVGIGASPFARRQGTRTAEHGLLAALDFARERQEDFAGRAKRACSGSRPDWAQLFRLSGTFIDYLDWGAFVLDNARGQAACLVLECIELLEAVSQEDPKKIREETGDVFYNFMAICLTLRIQAKHLGLTAAST